MEPTDWDRVLSIALEETARSRDSLVTVGAIFSTYVREVAQREIPGAQVPPDPDQSFKDFLLGHPEVVWLIPRKGKDVLVAAPHAAGEVARKVAPALLRQDLYRAFTDLNQDHSYWYDTEEDTARPVNQPTTSVRPPAHLHPIPQNTMEEEVQIRRAFVESGVLDGDVAEALRDSLREGRPLSAFSAILRENQISKAWHDFKFARLLQRVRDWSASERLPWRVGWIEPEPPTLGERPISSSVSGRDGIWQMLSTLDEADLARIMVPLDVVAKLLVGGAHAD